MKYNMDILFFFYSFCLLGILIVPFWFFYKNHILSNASVLKALELSRFRVLDEKRFLLLENLGDLKIERDTSKLSEEEFLELSKDIIVELKQIDSELKENGIVKKKTHCPSCNYSVLPDKARFCPMCGITLT